MKEISTMLCKVVLNTSKENMEYSVLYILIFR